MSDLFKIRFAFRLGWVVFVKVIKHRLFYLLGNIVTTLQRLYCTKRRLTCIDKRYFQTLFKPRDFNWFSVKFCSSCGKNNVEAEAKLLKLVKNWSVKGELRPEISLLHMKVLTLIKAKSNVFLWYVQCCSCTRRSKTNVKLNPRWRRPSRQYFGFRSSHAATALHVSKKNITFCFNQG